MKNLNADIREQIKELIINIDSYDTLEKEQIIEAKKWIESADEIFRIEKPDNPAMHLVSYFVVYDSLNSSIFLLVDHKKAQQWLPTGGHVEINENPAQTVVREAKEELGIKANFYNNKSTPFFITI